MHTLQYMYIYMYIFTCIHINKYMCTYKYSRTVCDFNPCSNIDVGIYSFCGLVLEEVFSIMLAYIYIYIGHILALNLYVRMVQ